MKPAAHVKRVPRKSAMEHALGTKLKDELEVLGQGSNGPRFLFIDFRIQVTGVDAAVEDIDGRSALVRFARAKPSAKDIQHIFAQLARDLNAAAIDRHRAPCGLNKTGVFDMQTDLRKKSFGVLPNSFNIKTGQIRNRCHAQV